jgi:L-alanine-DL-glutamate epimerase-like enolase superfamily enzyme
MANPTVRCRRIELSLRHTFRIARGASDVRRNVIVEIEHEGRVGLGEAAPILRYGEDQDSTFRAATEMGGRLGDPRAFAHSAARAAVAGQASAEAAIDIALHDLAGQRMGVPLHAMLGLDPRVGPPSSFTIGLDAPDVVARKVREASDYEVLKVKMGSEDDREVLTAVRDVTDRTVRVDANEGWTLESARERLPWLARMGVEFIEQPLPAAQLEETRALRARARCPSSRTRACTVQRTSRAWPAPSTASTSS